MTYAKQLLSKYCQNNVSFKALPHIMMHKMRAIAGLFRYWN